MSELRTNLKRYQKGDYSPGASAVKRACWFLVNAIVMRNPMNPSSGLKRFFLRAFGARVGTGVVLKPSLNIKYPWFLNIGNDSWIGENVWIDNLTHVVIGDNVCISQGAFLLTGNHDYKKDTFDLIVKKIILEDGVWIGAKAIVCPGVTCKSHAVLSVGSVAVSDLEPYSVYQGNPAVLVRSRISGL